ncbi:helix-turn-helix domain-containing protein [Eubacterium ventriosum]|nr:helix-turn-helix domain-containing protein [Eubacterium ventriosum]
MACYITAKVSDVMQCIGRENQEEYMEYKGLAVGNTIKSLRIKKNVSVFELAYRAKISQSHVYQLEEGSNKMSIDLLYRLMDALDTDANTILGIKENNENSVDERLKELSPKMKENLTELFLKTIDGVKK